MTYLGNQTETDSAAESSGGDSNPKSSGWKSKLKRWSISLGIGYLAIIIVLVCAEPYLVYPALLSDDSKTTQLPEVTSGFVEKLSVQTEDEIQLDVIHYCHGNDVKNSRGVFLFCHGNGEWIDRMTPFLIALGQANRISVVCFDYRGYGQSEGFPFENGILKDVDAVYERVVSLGYAPEQIIVFGRSIGGGPSCYLASKYEIGGLILQNTFSSLVDVAANKFFWLPIRWMMRNRFDSSTRLKEYQGPLLQTHGTSDRVVPFKFGKRLFEAAGTDESQKEFLIHKNGAHVDPMTNEFKKKIRTFLDRVLGPN